MIWANEDNELRARPSDRWTLNVYRIKSGVGWSIDNRFAEVARGTSESVQAAKDSAETVYRAFLELLRVAHSVGGMVDL